MGVKDFLFGAKPDYEALPNPYTGQLASLGYAFGPARKYWKSILKSDDASEIPGVGMFDSAEASAYEQSRTRPRLQSGYSNDRLASLEFERARRGIGADRMGYVQGVRGEAAQGLSNMFANYNQFKAGNLTNAANIYQNSYRDMSRQGTGFLGQLASGGFKPPGMG